MVYPHGNVACMHLGVVTPTASHSRPVLWYMAPLTSCKVGKSQPCCELLSVVYSMHTMHAVCCVLCAVASAH